VIKPFPVKLLQSDLIWESVATTGQARVMPKAGPPLAEGEARLWRLAEIRKCCEEKI